jgi:hypothetical protein
MKFSTQLLPALLCAAFVLGCGSTPVVREQPQWTRTLASTRGIAPKAKIRITVSGSTTPLLGSEQLITDTVRAQLSTLLKRRGFAVENTGTGYTAKLTYSTERNDKSRSPGFASSTLSTDVMTRPMTTSAGLGVGVAAAVGSLTSRSASAASQSSEQLSAYTHTIALELRDRDGAMAWKGESTWDSNELDIMDRIVPALRVLLSDLPADSTVRPAVREVKTTHTAQYYLLECVGVTFACPALPFGAAFDYAKINSNAKADVPRAVHDPFALAAYVDLLQSAEYALPSGSEEDWKTPMRSSLWKRVTLGGQYALGKDKKPINIIIKLLTTPNGYTVDECAVIADDEYAKFSGQLTKWKQALQEYYDVYTP